MDSGKLEMHLYFIRHGATRGNLEHRYVGRTNEEMLSGQKEKLEVTGQKLPKMDHIFSSPYLRCIQSAQALFGEEAEEYLGEEAESYSGEGAEDYSGEEAEGYPGEEAEDYPGEEMYALPGEKVDAQLREKLEAAEELREMDFGAFEYKNYKELDGNPDYQRFIDSGGKTAFPGGEDPKAFKRRCCAGFLKCMEQAVEKKWKNVAFVVHGGTIMAILEAYGIPKKDYYDYQVKNGEGFAVSFVKDAAQDRAEKNVPFYLCVEEKLS